MREKVADVMVGGKRFASNWAALVSRRSLGSFWRAQSVGQQFLLIDKETSDLLIRLDLLEVKDVIEN